MHLVKKNKAWKLAAKIGMLAGAMALAVPFASLSLPVQAQTVKVKPIFTNSMSWAPRDSAADTQSTFNFNVSDRFNGCTGLSLVSSNPGSATGSLHGFVATITVNAPGTPVFTLSGTDTQGNLVTDTFQVEINKLGDFTGDGVVTTADALFISRYLSGKVFVSEDEIMMMDINGDGVITNADAVALTSLYVGGSGSGSDVLNYTAIFRDINDVPIARSVSLDGRAEIGQQLTGNYTYFDVEKTPEGPKQLQWYIGSKADGSDKAPIAGAVSSTYTVRESDVGNYLFFGVTPVELGGPAGKQVISAASAKVQDTSVPVATLMAPVNEQVNVDPGLSALSITLSKNITATDKHIQIRKLSDNTVLADYAANDTTKITINGNKIDILVTGLQESTDYYVEIEAGAFQDVWHNPFGGLNGSSAWKFSTWDKTPPKIAALTPSNHAASVDAALSSLSMTFDENVSAISGKQVIIRQTADQLALATYAANDTNSVHVNGKVVTVSLPPLAESTGYYVEIEAGAFTDASGNSFGGLTGSSAWTFMTWDKTPPKIAALTPSNHAASVDAALSSLSMTFDENVSAISGKQVIIRQSADQLALATYAANDTNSIHVNGKVVTVSLPPLAESTSYYVEIEAGAFTDASGNPFAGLTGTSAWTFTTWDKTPPKIAALTPSNHAVSVDAALSSLSMTFDENVTAISGKQVIIRQSADHLALATYTANDTNSIHVNGKVVTVSLPPLAESTSYYVEIEAGAFTDASGNPFGGLTGTSAWTFTTWDKTPPAIVALTPNKGAMSVDASLPSLTVSFSKNVTAVSGKYVRLRKTSDQSEVAKRLVTDTANVSISGETVTIKVPTLVGGTDYYVEMDAGAFVDASNNSFAGLTGSSAWSFTTSAVVVATTLTAETDPESLTENNLDAALITLSVTGDTFKAAADESDFQLNNAPPGLSIALAYVDSGKAYLLLEHDWRVFSGDITNFSVTAKASALTKGVAATSNSMKITAVPQTLNPFFSEYLDGGNGRIALAIYYPGNGQPSDKASGYEVEVQQYMKATKSIRSYSRALFPISPKVPFIMIDSIFYDAFDLMNITYFNDDISMYDPNTFVTTALILKKNGQVIDVLGTPNATSATSILPGGGILTRKSGTKGGMTTFALNHWTKTNMGSAIYKKFNTFTP